MNTVLNSLKGRPWFGTMKTSFSFANFLWAAVLIFHLAVEPGHAAGTVVAWGGNDFSQSTVPAGLTNITAVAGGEEPMVTSRFTVSGSRIALSFNSAMMACRSGRTSVRSTASRANFRRNSMAVAGSKRARTGNDLEIM